MKFSKKIWHVALGILLVFWGALLMDWIAVRQCERHPGHRLDRDGRSPFSSTSSHQDADGAVPPEPPRFALGLLGGAQIGRGFDQVSARSCVDT